MKAFVTQELAPIKFCFLIKPNQKGTFHKCVKLSQSFWGGIYNPIIPVYKRFSIDTRIKFHIHNSEQEFYHNFLSNYDPDVIIYQEGLDEEYIKTIAGDREILNLNEFEVDAQTLNLKHGVSVIHLLVDILNQEFKYKRNDDLGVILPKKTSDLFDSILFCIPDDLIHKKVSEMLSGKDYYQLIEGIHTEYLKNLKPYSFNYRSIITNQIRQERSFSDYYEFIFLLDKSNLDDLIILWNLRAAGRRILSIDSSIWQSEVYDDLILEFYENSGQTGPSTLKSPNVEGKTLEQFAKHLEDLFKSKKKKHRLTIQEWIPRFGASAEIAQKDGTLSSNYIIKREFDHYELDQDHLRVPLPQFNMEVLRYSDSFVYRSKISVKYSDPIKKYPSVIHGINRVDWVQMTMDFGIPECRISNTGIVKFCRYNDDQISFIVPSSFDYLTRLFSKFAASIKRSPGNQLSNQIYKNINGEYGIHLFDSIGAISVLSELEGGNAITQEQLVASIKRNKPKFFEKRPNDYIKNLIDYKVIESGCVIQCSICGQHSFYRVDQLDTELQCSQCYSTYTTPLHDPKNRLKWNYRGIGPFSKNNKADGLIPGFLTLRLFDQHFTIQDGSTSLMNFDLTIEKQDYEVDLFVQLQNKISEIPSTELIFCECKTFKRFQQKDIDRLKKIGENFPQSILALCTLNDSFSNEEILLVKSLVNHFRKGFRSRPINPLFLLTSKELLTENHNPFQHYGKIHPSVKYGDYLGYLCDQSVKYYLNIETWNEIQLRKWQQFHKKRQSK